jgi:putative transcriptional regulator
MKNRIVELRSQYRLTQDDLAKKLNVSRQTIISLERERYNPSILLAYQIAQIFSLSIEEVFMFESKEEKV